MITSKENQKIKFAKSLKKGRNRKKYKCFLAEGFKLIQEAIKAGMEIECLFYSPGAYEGRKENILFLKKLLQNKIMESHFISDSLMNSLCDTVTGQGIMAVLKGEIPEIEDMDFSDNIWVLVFEVQDPGNLGTIIRTAEAAGAAGLFISPGTADPTGPKVIRSAMGAYFHIKLFTLKNTEKFIINSRNKGVKFIATHVSTGEDFSETNYNLPLVLLLGNEGQGLPENIISLSDHLINIPIYGSGESLNVGVAAGIILYEIRKKI